MWNTILLIGKSTLGTIIALIAVYTGMIGRVPKKEEELKNIQGHLTPTLLFLLEVILTITLGFVVTKNFWWALAIWSLGGYFLAYLIEDLYWRFTPKEKNEQIVKTKIEKHQKEEKETDAWLVEHQKEERERKRIESMSPAQLQVLIDDINSGRPIYNAPPLQLEEIEISSAVIRGADKAELAKMITLLDKRSDREYNSDKTAYSDTCDLIKEIGRKLNRDGGEDLMKEVLTRAGTLGCNTRFVEREWNGIGTWLG